MFLFLKLLTYYDLLIFNFFKKEILNSIEVKYTVCQITLVFVTEAHINSCLYEIEVHFFLIESVEV